MKNYVYLVQAGRKGPVKIGVAANVEKRIRSLQTSQYVHLRFRAAVPCESRKLAEMFEWQLHKWCKKRKMHIRGEWFQPECLEYLDKLVNHISGAKDQILREIP